MKKYFVCFTNAEAFLRMQYQCKDVKKCNDYIFTSTFANKDIVIVYFNRKYANFINTALQNIIKECDEVLIVNFKNKLSIDIDFLPFFESVLLKEYTYLENRVHSCHQDRIGTATKSLLTNLSSDVAKKNLEDELEICRNKKNILDYLSEVLEKDDKENKILYNILYIIYCINYIQGFMVKNIFYTNTNSLEEALEYYSKRYILLQQLYREAIISYPFDDECEVIKSNQILNKEKQLIESIKKDAQKVEIHDKNSIYLSDLAYIFHIENEDSDSDVFDGAIRTAIEKEIFYFYEGKIYMSKFGEKLMKSMEDRTLQKYLEKGIL